MKRAVMVAACVMAATSMMLCGCGSGEEIEQEQNSGNLAQDSQNTEESNGGDPAQGELDDEDEIRKEPDAGEQDGDDMTENREETAALSVDLAGMTFSVLGDSISTFRDYNPTGYAVFFPEFGEVTDVEDTWWQQVADDLELTLYVNGSSSGSTAVGDSTGTENPLCGCNELRTNDLAGPKGACPDMIVIYIGTNDMLNAIPLGDNDGTRLVEEGEVATFSDAYTLMLDKLQANYPLAQFYCCTLLPVGDYGTDTPYVDFVNGARLTSKDYGEAIARIAENRGLFVIDLYDCGVTIENLQEMTTDGVHPTVAGMKCIAEAVEKVLVGQAQ